MKWYAVFDRATGEAVSFGTELADPLPAHLEAVEIAGQPGRKAGTRWDAATRGIVALPASPPPPDRVAELLADETVVAITAKLTAGERAALAEKLRGKFGA